MTITLLNRRQIRKTLMLVEYDIKYCIKSIISTNDSFRCLDYENDINVKICIFILQNRLRNITVTIIKLIIIFTCNVVKTFNLLFSENVKFSSIIHDIEENTFEKNEKNLIDNVII